VKVNDRSLQLRACLGEIPPCPALASLSMGMSVRINVVCKRVYGNRSGHVGLDLMPNKAKSPHAYLVITKVGNLVAVFRTRPTRLPGNRTGTLFPYMCLGPERMSSLANPIESRVRVLQ
jgi:hypothetical protein